MDFWKETPTNTGAGDRDFAIRIQFMQLMALLEHNREKTVNR